MARENRHEMVIASKSEVGGSTIALIAWRDVLEGIAIEEQSG
jgi:hypothetical protein